MGRIAAFLYGVAVYVIFFLTFLYAIGFVGNVFVPKSIDSGIGGFSLAALAINALLLGLFAIQHSVMARHWFKRAWTKVVPHPVERSTYVLLASLCLILLFWQWRAMTGVIWNVENPYGQRVLWALFAVGWLLVLASTFFINHFDLFGLRQVFLYLRSQPYSPVSFKGPFLYKHVRHPIYLGFVLAFWSATRMTQGHLLFALGTTGYILLAIQFEERDLITSFGDTYAAYRQHTSMLIPFLKKRS